MKEHTNMLSDSRRYETISAVFSMNSEEDLKTRLSQLSESIRRHPGYTTLYYEYNYLALHSKLRMLNI